MTAPYIRYSIPAPMVMLDLVESPAFVLHNMQLLLLLPRSPADHTGERSEADARQVLNWEAQSLGFLSPNTMVHVFESVDIVLSTKYTEEEIKPAYHKPKGERKRKRKRPYHRNVCEGCKGTGIRANGIDDCQVCDGSGLEE